jgi:hypothetical protein
MVPSLYADVTWGWIVDHVMHYKDHVAAVDKINLCTVSSDFGKCSLLAAACHLTNRLFLVSYSGFISLAACAIFGQFTLGFISLAACAIFTIGLKPLKPPFYRSRRCL